jgi:hypothetical protein
LFCLVKDIGRLGRLGGLEILAYLVQVAFDCGHQVWQILAEGRVKPGSWDGNPLANTVTEVDDAGEKSAASENATRA